MWSVFNGFEVIPIPKKGNAKECSNYHTIALISHTIKVRLKIPQARLQQCMNRVQGGFRKGRGTRDQIVNIRWIKTSVGSKKKQENSRISTSASLTSLKPFTVWITRNCGKFFKR